MSRNGSGTYNLPSGNPVVTATTITSTWANTTLNDIGTALTGSLAADGQTPATGNLNMNINQIKNVVDPSLAQDAATKAYVDAANSLALLKANNLSDVADATTSRTNLIAAKSGANSDITSITGLTTPLTVAQGGTGVTTSTGSGANVLGTSPSISGAIFSSMASSVITSGTAAASTSGTSIDFTGIPSWVKRVTVMYSGISVNGTSNLIIQVGAGSVTTSGYTSSFSLAVNTSLSTTTSTAGLVFANAGNASFAYSGQMIISTLGSNKWVCSVNTNEDASARAMFGAGSITLGGALDRIRFTTTSGSDTFDAGTINILYE